MASYVETSTLENHVSSEEIQELMKQKATELFKVCDKENKGFITKRDMQRLQTELPLNPQQLEDVFESLDDDSNGFLTLEEFTDGFGGFLGMPATLDKQSSLESSSSHSEHVYENEHVDSGDEEDNFRELMNNIDMPGVMDDTDTVRSLWTQLRQEQPELLGNFEDFLKRMTGELRRTQTDYHTLESALKNKTTAHDEEVRKLYEEMENQIKLEKERVLAEEKAREKQLKEDMERDVEEKDRALQDLLYKHQEMEMRLGELNTTEVETKQENDRLAKDKEQLEELLSQSQYQLEDTRSSVQLLKHQYRDEKRQRAMAAFQISEGIALERESLVKQLDLLRDMNRKLRDDKDEAELRRELPSCLHDELAEEGDAIMNGSMVAHVHRDDTCDSDNETDTPISRQMSTPKSAPPSTHATRMSGSHRRKQLSKQGSVMSNYFNSGPPSRENSMQAGYGEDDIECDEPLDEAISYSSYSHASSTPNHLIDNNNHGEDSRRSKPMAMMSDSELEEEVMAVQRIRAGGRKSGNGQDHVDHSYRGGMETEFDIKSPRAQPVGANSITETTELSPDVEGASPERVFKIVFIGDSGVGKSSFIHQFCSHTFKPTFSATIGVDFQIKNLRVDGHVVALQLWDTAGQERFRSITKQYFRKADGVLIMYDVTSEFSFRNIRNWMTSVQDGTDEGTVLAVIGNKMDLVDESEDRPVTTKDGSRLADEFGALFYEASAKTGMNVRDSLQGMASLLREREDIEMEKALNLEMISEKKGCCS